MTIIEPYYNDGVTRLPPSAQLCRYAACTADFDLLPDLGGSGDCMSMYICQSNIGKRSCPATSAHRAGLM